MSGHGAPKTQQGEAGEEQQAGGADRPAGQHTGRTAPAEKAGGEEKQRDREPGQAVHRHPDLSRKEDMDKDDAVNGDTFPQVQLVVVSAPALHVPHLLWPVT